MSNESDFAAWHRASEEDEWNNHIHSIRIGDPGTYDE
jgi:hypothetical protein